MNKVIATQTTDNSVEVVTTQRFNKQDIWDSLVGSEFRDISWASNFDFDTWNKPCDLTITHLTKHGDRDTTTTITPNQIYSAFAQLVKENTTHCFSGNYLLSDLDNSDSCFADYVLQQAIFGKIIYG